MTPGDEAAAQGIGSADEALTVVAVRVARPAWAGARLVALRTGREVGVPAAGLVIGRDAACGLVLGGEKVSRRHAVVWAGPAGYTITDQSANGTRVNGAPVLAAHPIVPGDVIGVGDEELRFELDGAPPAPSAAAAGDGDATMVLAHAARPAPPHPRAPRPPESRPAGPRPSPRASLEVLTGADAGAVHQVERLAVSIGRGEHNDLRVADASVSAAHATLLLKGSVWHVVDLGSANGTYVDGYRVAGERALPAGCTLRVGNVKLGFQPHRVGARGRGTRRVAGLFARLSRALSHR